MRPPLLLRPLKFLLPVLACLCPWTVYALDSGLSISQYAHDQWSRRDGLPASGVKAIAQTEDAYLWLGTTAGVVRFDGVKFTELPTVRSDPSRREYITALLASKGNRLIVGTQNSGLRIISNQIAEELSLGDLDPSVNALHQDSQGILRYCAPANLFVLDSEGNHRREDTQTSYLTGASEDPQGRLWISSHGGVEYRENGAWKLVPETKGLICTTVLADSHGGVWIGTWNNLFLWKDQRLVSVNQDYGILSSHIMTLYEDRQGNVWVGSKEGINRFKAGVLSVLGKGDRFKLNRAQSILEDKEGSLWVGTDDGLHRFKDVKLVPWTADEGIIGNFTASVNEGADGSVYVMSSGDPYGITRLRNGVIKRFDQNMDGPSYAAKDGSLWISNTGALLKLSGDTITTYGREEGILPHWISFICEDEKGLILGYADSQGLRRWSPGKTEPYLYADGTPLTITFHIISAHRQPDDTLWLCGYDGLWKLKNGDLTRYTSKEGELSRREWYRQNPQSPQCFRTVVAEGLVDDWLNCLADDEKGTLWLASARRGLSRFRDGVFHSFGTKEGLPTNQIFSVQVDQRGDLWMSGPRGIFRVSGEELEACAAGRLAAVKPELFTTEDGMKNEECMNMYQPSGVKTQDGRLWFASKMGAVVIDPTTLRRNSQPPPVFIEGVMADGVQHPIKAGSLELKAGTEKLEIAFTGLSLLVPDRVGFKYRLEGYDSGWVDSQGARSAHYTRLPPGDYRFEVMACNNDGVWNEKVASLVLVQRPFFFQTLWFYLLCGAVGAGLIVGTHKVRVRNLKHREILLQERVDNRTRELSLTNERLRSEMGERQRAEQEVERVHRQLMTASHQAGMAEVATGILHNVGNVLNSVNISTLLLIKTVRDSKSAGLRRVADLLREHKADLGDYLSKDPKGKHVAPYIEELSGHLSTEQSKLLGELEQLRQNVDHIKEIVAMQQDFAKVSGVVETIRVADLLEDAIRMNERALARHVVTLERDFGEAADTPLEIERHKGLQILVNILQNAKNACADTGLKDRRIVVSLKKLEDRIQITVTDNGVGIAPEHMSRLFVHGFTTRKDGHGFGLHSSSLAAKSLGGVLSASSQGLGLGAVFTLELPLRHTSA